MEIKGNSEETTRGLFSKTFCFQAGEEKLEGTMKFCRCEKPVEIQVKGPVRDKWRDQ